MLISSSIFISLQYSRVTLSSLWFKSGKPTFLWLAAAHRQKVGGAPVFTSRGLGVDGTIKDGSSLLVPSIWIWVISLTELPVKILNRKAISSEIFNLESQRSPANPDSKIQDCCYEHKDQ